MAHADDVKTLTVSSVKGKEVVVFERVGFKSVFEIPADAWFLLSVSDNPYFERVDWELGLLIRRNRLLMKADEPLLLAAPVGWLTPRVVVLPKIDSSSSSWLQGVYQKMRMMRLRVVVLLPPTGLPAPTPKDLTLFSESGMKILWVDSSIGSSI